MSEMERESKKSRWTKHLDGTKPLLEKYAWFHDSFWPSFKEMYGRTVDSVTSDQFEYAKERLKNVEEEATFLKNLPRNPSVDVKKYLRRVVVHSTKQELDNEKGGTLSPVEWFAVVDNKEGKKWIPLSAVKNLDDLLSMMFKKELKQLLRKVDDLVGLEDFKNRFFPDLAASIIGSRQTRGGSNSLPKLMLLGDPGTGKSTLMCFLGQLYWLAGRLKFGHTPCVSMTNSEPWMGKQITSGYVGATAGKVTRAVLDAKGGVFALDEAHTLCEGEHGYGRDALQLINGSISNNPDILWIFAGYQQEMRRDFVNQEKGMSSRIDHEFVLQPYNAKQLAEITRRYILRVGLKIDASGVNFLEKRYRNARNWPKDFGNARAAVTVGEKSCFEHNVEAGNSGSSSKLVSLPALKEGFSSWFKGMEGKNAANLVKFKRSQMRTAPQKFVETMDEYARKNGPLGVVKCMDCDKCMVDAFDEYRCRSCPRIRSGFCCGEKVISERCFVCGKAPEECMFENWKEYEEFIVSEMLDNKLIYLRFNNEINVLNQKNGEDVRLARDDDDERITLSRAAAESGILMAMLVAVDSVKKVGRTFPFLSDVSVAQDMIRYGYYLFAKVREKVDLVEEDGENDIESSSASSPLLFSDDEDADLREKVEEDGQSDIEPSSASFSLSSSDEEGADPAQILISNPTEAQKNSYNILVEFVRENCVYAEGNSILAREFLQKLEGWLKKRKESVSRTMVGKLIRKKREGGQIYYLNLEFK